MSKSREVGRRAGLKHNDHWPSPNDGLGNPQNNPKGEYTEKDMEYKGGTNEEMAPGIGKANPGNPAAEAANQEAIRRRNQGRRS